MSSGQSLFQNKPKQNDSKNKKVQKGEASSIELIMPGGKKHVFNEPPAEQSNAGNRMMSRKAHYMQNNVSKTVENTPDHVNLYCGN